MSEDHREISQRRARWMAEVQEGNRASYRALLDEIGPVVRQ
jgi:hypothetical protein